MEVPDFSAAPFPGRDIYLSPFFLLGGGEIHGSNQGSVNTVTRTRNVVEKERVRIEERKQERI